MKSKNMTLMVVAIGCGLVAAFLTARLSGGSSPEKIEVIVAKRELPVGTLLEEKELDTGLLVAAIETLSKIGAKGAPNAELTKLLRTKAVPALTQIIGDGDETLQLSAINALGAKYNGGDINFFSSSVR